MQIFLELVSEKDVTYLSRGNFTAVIGEITVTSRNLVPDQSFLLFCALGDFFDLLTALQNDPSIKRRVFTVVGSNFSFVIERAKDKIWLRDGKLQTERVLLHELALCFWNEFAIFMERYGLSVRDLDVIGEDLQRSLEKFRKAFYI